MHNLIVIEFLNNSLGTFYLVPLNFVNSIKSLGAIHFITKFRYHPITDQRQSITMKLSLLQLPKSFVKPLQ